MVLQLCRESLCDTMGRALDDGAPLEEAFVRATFCQLLGALEHRYSHGVVHRDLKLDNLCWLDDEESHLLLWTLATHRRATRIQPSPAARITPRRGPPHVRGGHRATRALLGVQGGRLVGGRLPLRHACDIAAIQRPEETDEQRAASGRRFTRACLTRRVAGVSCSPPALAVLECMLQVEAADRASLEEVISHEWIGGMSHVPWQGEGEGEFEEVAL